MFGCALRFDAYAWLKTKRNDDELDLRPWFEPLISTFVFHDDQAANFAVFFALQRSLFKWGEREKYFSPHHTAFRLLFLHLYRQPTPAGFANVERDRRWDALDKATLETHAAAVRRALLSSRLNREIEAMKTPQN